MAYRSKLERFVADHLSKRGVEFTYESQHLNYILECKYIPDFILNNGIYIETKGYLDQADRRKMIAVKRANPDLDIRIIFQAPYNKATPKMTYAQWAEKNGFPWCSVHSIPESWLNQSQTATESF